MYSLLNVRKIIMGSKITHVLNLILLEFLRFRAKTSNKGAGGPNWNPLDGNMVKDPA